MCVYDSNHYPVDSAIHFSYNELQLSIIVPYSLYHIFENTDDFFRDKADMLAWVEGLNLVAASFSSPPLPAPVGSK